MHDRYDDEDDEIIVITFVGRYEVHYRNTETGKRWVELSAKYIR